MADVKLSDEITARMIKAAPDGIDVSPGSIFYDAIRPLAIEIAELYDQVERVLDEAFPDTCGEESLLRHAESLGIKRRAATRAVAVGRFDKMPPVGSRFLLGRFVYTIGDYMEEYTSGRYKYKLVCDTAGSGPNGCADGELIPLSYIEGLTFCSSDGILEAGRDEESVESLRGRVISARRMTLGGGSAGDYTAAALAVDGVGAAKIYPAWNGGGTVRILVMGAGGTAPDSGVVDAVRAAAAAIAPIGHEITVAAATATPVAVNVTAVYADGWNAATAKAAIEGAVREFIRDACDKFASSDSLTLHRSVLEAKIYETGVVKSVTSLNFDGAEGDLALGADAFPVFGSAAVS